MKKENNLMRYLSRQLFLIFFLFALVSIAFNVFTYLRERQYYFEIIEEEQQNRIDTLSRNVDEELTKLKITANMRVRSQEALDLFNRYSFVNSFERDRMIGEIKSGLMELDNLNSFVSESALYFPEKGVKIDREGIWEDDSECSFFLKLYGKNELIAVYGERAYIIEAFPKNIRGKDVDPKKILSVFVIELDVGQILKELQFAKMMENDILLMTSPEEDAVYFQTDAIQPASLKEVIGEERIDRNGKEYLIMRAENEGNFFHLYYLQDQEFLHLIQEKMVTNIFLLAGAVFLTILTAFALFYKKIFRPLELLLVEAFGQVRMSHFSYRIPLPQRGNVFRNLYENFNYMAERIDTLVSRELKQQILVNQANFKHLQAQINPHFMYNSYFLLYRLIKKGDREGSLLVCENLGNFFRYINRDSGENKSLSEEVEHARSYAAIQGFRYRGLIRIEFPPLPERYGYIEVPRLILQPLIENVFKYVVSEMEAEEEIILKVSYEEGEKHLFVRVENSGSISEETMDEIERKLERPKEGEEVTALMNINARLNVFFRQEDSMTVCRSELGGLEICLRLKL